MASGDRYQHVTVTTSASTVTVSTGTRRVEVLNRTGTGEVYVSTNGTTPTVGGAFAVLPASLGAAMVLDMEGGGTAVRLIASAATDVSVSVVA